MSVSYVPEEVKVYGVAPHQWEVVSKLSPAELNRLVRLAKEQLDWELYQELKARFEADAAYDREHSDEEAL